MVNYGKKTFNDEYFVNLICNLIVILMKLVILGSP